MANGFTEAVTGFTDFLGDGISSVLGNLDKVAKSIIDTETSGNTSPGINTAPVTPVVTKNDLLIYGGIAVAFIGMILLLRR